MIYLIGGPPRVGKSLLARRVGSILGSGWLSTDMLRETLKIAVPELGLFDWRDPPGMEAHTKRILPFMQRLVGMADAIDDNYVIEGLEVTPNTIAALRSICPARALVLCSIQPNLDDIRRHGGT